LPRTLVAAKCLDHFSVSRHNAAAQTGKNAITMIYRRIVTHNDFDGLVSAALCSHVEGIDSFFYTGPRDIQTNRFPLYDTDIICDLPYSAKAGMWFDHHPGNLEAVIQQNIEPESIPGRFSPDPSCARTVYDYYSAEWDLADYFAYTVDQADMIDSFDYFSVEDWRSPSPGKTVDNSIRAPFPDNSTRLRYLNQLTAWLRDYSLEEVELFSHVQRLNNEFEQHERSSREIIREAATFLSEPQGDEIVFVDLTGYRTRPHVVRHMAYIEFPEVKAAAVLANPEFNRVKTTNVSVSMSLAVGMNLEDHSKDVGEIMRTLGVGDGHPGAGAGLLETDSKMAMFNAKEKLMRDILQLWRDQ